MTDKRIRIILDSAQADKNAKKTDKNVRNIGKSADGAQFAVKRLASAIASAFAVDRIVKYADSFTQVQNQIRRTVDSSEDLVRTTAELLEVSNATRSSIEATTELYTSLTVSTQNLNISQEEVIGVTKTINNLFLESGKSAAESEGAIRQLGQALQSGALRGDEFNSVAEGAPGILRAVELQTGKTRAELRDFAADGQITAELIVKSLQSYEDAAQSAADKTVKTLAQSWVIAENNATAFVGANKLVQQSVGATGDIIITLSENLDILVNIAGAAAALYIARLIPAITASTAGFVAQASAALTSTASINAYGAVVTGASVKTRTLAASAVAARGALSFLGGPLGILFLVATAFVAYSRSATDAEDKTSSLADTTDVLTQSFKDLTAAQSQAQAIDVAAEIEKQTIKVIDLQAKIDRLQVTTADGFLITLDVQGADEVTRAQAEIDTATAKLDALNSRLSSLNNQSGEAASPKDSAPVADNGVVSSARATTAALQRELDLRRQISDIYLTADLDAQTGQFERERVLIDINNQERRAIAEASYAEDQARRLERFTASIDNDKLENQQKVELQLEFDKQKELAKLNHNEALNNIDREGAQARISIAELEQQSKRDAVLSIGSSILSIAQGQNKKAFEIGKKAAIASAAIDGTRSAISAWRSGMETAGPWAPVVAAGYTLASVAKTTGLISQLKSRSYSGGGASSAGGGGGIPSVAGRQAPVQPASQVQGPNSGNQGQSTTIVLSGDTQSTDNVLEALMRIKENGGNIDALIRQS